MADLLSEGHTAFPTVEVIDEIYSPATMAQAEALRQRFKNEFGRADTTEHLRPLLFPRFLWRFVFDREREKVQERWNKFSLKRQLELCRQLEEIKISAEDEERRAEHHFFRAQCYAHINAYGHVDPENPPFIKDKKMKIVLSDLVPFGSKNRWNSILQDASLAAKTNQLVRNGKMELSVSPYSSSPHQVPITQRISEFMSKHKEGAVKVLYDPEHEDVVAALYRLTIDYRRLNAASYLEQWPLPRILPLLDRASGSDRYSSMDLPDAFHSLFLEESSRPCTAILTPKRLLQYCCMPQGHKNSANVWSRVVWEVFTPLEHEDVITYQDDQVNHAREFLAHLILQGRIYSILEEYNMIHKWQKTNLNFRSMKILGHVLSKEGRGPDPKAEI